MEALNMTLFLKSLLRVLPALAFIQVPLSFPLLLKFLFSIPLALILSQRLGQEYIGIAVELGVGDLLLGLGVGAFVSLFFSAAMKVSLFFSPITQDPDEPSDSPWRQVVDSFFFLFLLLGFMALKLERNLLELLALPASNSEKLLVPGLWVQMLTDLTWLALKLSSFGFLLVLTQRLFEEVYRRMGGESLRMLFSICVWIAFLIVSPLLFPSFRAFISEELASFWMKWLGVAL